MALTYVNVREKTNKNDHDSIYVFNKFARSGKFSPYCAAGLYYTAHRAGLDFDYIKFPAGVRYWFDNPELVIWDRYRGARWRTPPKLMDVVWIFGSHIEAIATWHLPRDIADDDYILTIGFNTSGNTGKYHGVWYPIKRRWRHVKRVANHVSPYARDHECE